VCYSLFSLHNHRQVRLRDRILAEQARKAQENAAKQAEAWAEMRRRGFRGEHHDGDGGSDDGGGGANRGLQLLKLLVTSASSTGEDGDGGVGNGREGDGRYVCNHNPYT
jgi:hypothetical protein